MLLPLQKYEPKDFSGLVTENHLGAMFGLEPILTSPLIENIFDVNLGYDLDRFMDRFPTHEIEDDRPFEWVLQGAEYKNYPLISATNIAGDLAGSAAFPKAGINLTRFYLEFPERAFEATDVIIGEEDTETLFFHVKTDPKPSGTNWVYEVELLTGDYNLFAPASALAAGQRFSKEYSLTEQTLSKRGGNVSHTSPFRMQNVCSMIRKEYEVPGNMILKGENKPLAFSFKDDKGKIHTTWLKKLDWDFMKEFKREKSLLMMYAQPNKAADGTYKSKGESGYEIRHGAGLMAQVAPTNVFYYNTFNLDMLTEVIMSLSYGKLAEDSRKFVLGTGEYGFIQFHKEVEKRGIAFSYNNAGGRISGSGNDLKLGGQFVSYGYLNGIEITLMKIPHFDDIVREKQMHPDGGTVKSREYLVMDFGTQGGQNNIQKVKIKGFDEAYRYIPGLRDPFSATGEATKPGMTASSVDGYKVMKAFWGGVKVCNPMRMARLLPNLV